jgi:hypothetical protein
MSNAAMRRRVSRFLFLAPDTPTQARFAFHSGTATSHC